jgi:hypothetical protein
MSTTTGEPATYQRLRARLSFLKLPAAAEALPGIPDGARAEELSTAAVLEQLLAVEVHTTQAPPVGVAAAFHLSTSLRGHVGQPDSVEFVLLQLN